MNQTCHCGHPADEHWRQAGHCLAETYRPEIGRAFGCFCQIYEKDDDD